MTPAEFRAARAALGLSAGEMARVLRVANSRTVRRWETDGEEARDILGPVEVLLEVMLAVPEARKYLGLPVDLGVDILANG